MTRVVPASSLNLNELALAFNASFEGYYVDVHLTAETMARRIRLDQIDLHRSVLVYSGEELLGMSLLAVRGNRSWVGGFGITLPFRGQGKAGLLFDALRRQAVGVLTLEVLQQNVRARQLYERRGMRIVRDLLVMQRNGAARGKLKEAHPAELLARFGRWPRPHPAWQRDLPALLTIEGLRGYECDGAYALLCEDRVMDLAAADAGAARELCRGLEGPLKLINEPEDSLFLPYFVETGRQHEMVLDQSYGERAAT